MSNQLRWMKTYPVEGDTAIAEMWAGKENWADVRLEGIHLDAHGDARLADARVVLTVFRPCRKSDFAPNGRDWELDVYLVLEQLTEARQWLQENERGRSPTGEGRAP